MAGGPRNPAGFEERDSYASRIRITVSAVIPMILSRKKAPFVFRARNIFCPYRRHQMTTEYKAYAGTPR